MTNTPRTLRLRDYSVAEQRIAKIIAGRVGCDVRTVLGALSSGVKRVRSLDTRARVAEALSEYGLEDRAGS